MIRAAAPPLTGEVDAYEDELARYLGVADVVAVSSGTTALQTGLYAAGVRPGDRVIVPALTVVMTVAPVVALGAQPVFVDCNDDGTDFDLDDLTAHLDGATAIVPVYLWGRAPGSDAVRHLAARRGIPVVVDACQALGTMIGRTHAGLDATVGCYSTHHLKLLSTGEGGFLATDDSELAATARAYRSHWLTAPPQSAPASRIAHNFRLAEPLAALGRAELTRLDEQISWRTEQTLLMIRLLAEVKQLEALVPRRQRWNHYAPVFRLHLDRPRAFAEHLAGLDIPVPNSTGTFKLIPLDQRPMFADETTPRCTTAATVLDSILAIALTRADDHTRITQYAAIIEQEVHRWVDA
ncbi:aminotransferase class I/II-fold pyridoxal phosphate-dependent enzyme [Nocardia sp.]|uniref:DegT/DnrJ/EryC1/StrS family aminotransferase n=1 Tax=Nocardia sp. TaxID=1821 RepID=UPI0025875A8D|nr:aminotransferase class I/II-fold pyridoxal phosphate-dependent enzyme [Nocardia sp.]